jgi:hypothetical protein
MHDIGEFECPPKGRRLYDSTDGFWQVRDLRLKGAGRELRVDVSLRSPTNRENSHANHTGHPSSR